MKHHVVISEETIEKRGSESEGGAEKKVEELLDRGKDYAKEYYERKTRITKPIALDDLFKRRSLRPGDPEVDVRRVLVYGNPGSGKTCLTKVIAHKWARGEMAQEFNAVYVVPVRVLNSTNSERRQWKRLEAVISRICFSEKQCVSDCEDLEAQINDDLDDPLTLLVVDGLDEANDNGRELISTIWKRSCKILLLSRPYNMKNMEARADIQVECLGFTDHQLQDYIRSELTEDESRRLTESLQISPAMWEMAHVPVTAHILCSLSKNNDSATKGQGKSASIFQLYNDMVNYIWARFKEKFVAKNIKRCDLFDDLENIAFEAIRNGLIRIPSRIVTQCATSTGATGIFKESGLLLLVLKGEEYQFPHLTFQEYFAGKYIAKILHKRGLNEETTVLDFIHEEKYNRKHALTLSFALRAFAHGQGRHALQEMVSIVDKKPIEVLGVQNFLLKMEVLEATLEEANGSCLKMLIKDEKAIEISTGAYELLTSTRDHVLIRQTVVERFEQCIRVLQEFPSILNGIIDETKQILASPRSLTWKAMDRIQKVLKLARHSPRHINEIIQWLNDEDWCKTEECIRKFECLASEVPQFACEFLPMLERGCGDEDSSVRQNAVEAVGRVVGAAPQLAGDLLPMLWRGCGDDDSSVRQNAAEAVGRVVGAAPQLAGDLLPMLWRGCGDDDSSVRQNAAEAVGRVVGAAPQLAGDLLPMLERGRGDEDSSVRQNAMEAVGRVVGAAPQLAGDLMPILVSGCGDEDSSVRRNAMEAIGRVVRATPQLAGNLLPMLESRCNDKDDPWERARAMEAVGRVIGAAPRLADKFLPMLKKGCGDEDTWVRRIVLRAIGQVVAVTPQFAGNLLPKIESSCCDGDSSERARAMKAVGLVVGAAPHFAGDLLPMLARGCGDGNPSERARAMKAVGRTVWAAPYLAGDLLPTLNSGCDDKDPWVRAKAMEAVGRGAVAAPQLTGDLLPKLTRGCSDKDPWVRRTSIGAIEQVVGVAPQLAGDLLATLNSGCDDKDPWVRARAVEAVGRVVVEAPQLAGDLLPMLERGCGDKSLSVRGKAMEAVGRVVGAAPQLAGDLLPMLERGCGDEDSAVRQNAVETVRRVVGAAPCLTGDFLPTLVMGCGDEDFIVSQAAATAFNGINLGRVIPLAISSSFTFIGYLFVFFVRNSFTLNTPDEHEKIPIVLHTIASEELGSWAKKDLAHFFQSLRKEFGIVFPGLLKNLKATSELTESSS